MVRESKVVCVQHTVKDIVHFALLQCDVLRLWPQTSSIRGKVEIMALRERPVGWRVIDCYCLTEDHLPELPWFDIIRRVCAISASLPGRERQFELVHQTLSSMTVVLKRIPHLIGAHLVLQSRTLTRECRAILATHWWLKLVKPQLFPPAQPCQEATFDSISPTGRTGRVELDQLVRGVAAMLDAIAKGVRALCQHITYADLYEHHLYDARESECPYCKSPPSSPWSIWKNDAALDALLSVGDVDLNTALLELNEQLYQRSRSQSVVNEVIEDRGHADDGSPLHGMDGQGAVVSRYGHKDARAYRRWCYLLKSALKTMCEYHGWNHHSRYSSENCASTDKIEIPRLLSLTDCGLSKTDLVARLPSLPLMPDQPLLQMTNLYKVRASQLGRLMNKLPSVLTNLVCLYLPWGGWLLETVAIDPPLAPGKRDDVSAMT